MGLIEIILFEKIDLPHSKNVGSYSYQGEDCNNGRTLLLLMYTGGETEEPVWTPDDCTEKVEATSFGTIQFTGFDGEADDQQKPVC